MDSWTEQDQETLDRLRADAEAASNLLQPPICARHVDEALHRLRGAAAAGEYVQRRLAGVPAPRKGDQ